MLLDINAIHRIYQKLSGSVSGARALVNKPLTLTEKILYGHLFDPLPEKPFKRGIDYVNFLPDRVAMQDATAQMALLQFMTAGRKTIAVPATVHCDHLIQANAGGKFDLEQAVIRNKEVYHFLQSVSAKFGIGSGNPAPVLFTRLLLRTMLFREV
jgi:aconitate hydratase